MSTVITYKAPSALNPLAVKRLPGWRAYRADKPYLDYDVWLASAGAKIINLRESFFSGIFYIEFENEEDALAFKLRYL